MVVVDIDGLSVIFPYPTMYPEQRAYMREMKRALDAAGHGLLESPSGTGKTITILALVTAWMDANRASDAHRKFVYCTRTVEEMEKCLAELKILVGARERELGVPNDILAVGLASRRHLCIHETVGQLEGSAVDNGCRAITASWVREASDVGAAEGDRLCSYFENYDKEGVDAILRPGVYDLADLRAYGRRRGWCSYFLARHSVTLANIIVYSYHYLLDPCIASVVSANLPAESIIVFGFFMLLLWLCSTHLLMTILSDEAHNIDNVCIEALSVDLDSKALSAAARNITQLNSAIYGRKRAATDRLNEEYTRILSGLPAASLALAQRQPPSGHLFVGGEELPAAPVLPDDILEESVPEAVRKAEQFVAFLGKLVRHLQARTRTDNVVQERPTPFLRKMASACGIADSKPFQAAHDRLISLMRTLQVASFSEFNQLQHVASFCTMLSTYEKEGMQVLIEPFDDFTGERAPVLRLACVDASLAMRWIVNKFRSVVITSGTLSPLSTYPRMLNFECVVSASFNMSLDRRCVCPVVLSRGSDQTTLSSKFSERQSNDVPRNYGNALLELAACVPDGIVVFFVSYVHMQQVVRVWTEQSNTLERLQELKLVFVETNDSIESSLAIQQYKVACDSGRGAILLSVARGRAAEGIDFDGQYGRLCILFGVPFQYTESRILKARLEFLATHHQINEADFLVFDAARQASQCAGRVIRNKNDYGVIVFADVRYGRGKVRSKLPRWISQFLSAEHLDVDICGAVGITKRFLLEMAQPVAPP